MYVMQCFCNKYCDFSIVCSTENLQNPVGSNWSMYTCLSVTMGLDINSFILAQLRSNYSECLQRSCSYGNVIFTRIEFENSNSFWIDELYVARQDITSKLSVLIKLLDTIHPSIILLHSFQSASSTQLQWSKYNTHSCRRRCAT